jgi:LPS sulfotransferase NodH
VYTLMRLARREHVAHLRVRLSAVGVESSFFICTAPRTGSNLLARLLAGTGKVGWAAERFGNPIGQVSALWLRARFGDYLVESADDARGTGAYGTKLHWNEFGRLRTSLRSLRGTHRLSDRELLEAVFPTPRFISLEREDVVAQAVSWWRAEASRVWVHGHAPEREPAFNFDEIHTREELAREWAEAWNRWFAAQGIEPFRVSYEEIVADMAGVTRRVLAFLGIDLPADASIEPGKKRQADALNEEWLRRYRELAPG